MLTEQFKKDACDIGGSFLIKEQIACMRKHYAREQIQRKRLYKNRCNIFTHQELTGAAPHLWRQSHTTDEITKF
jgi:hypothetical protein